MIGTSIRSIRHLFRVSDASLKTVLIRFKGESWEFCKVFKTKDSPKFGDTLFIFNNAIRQSHWDYNSVVSSKEFSDCAKYEDIAPFYGRIFSISSSELDNFSQVFNEIILLPNSFDKDYENFLRENTKMIHNLQCTLGISTNDIRTKRMYIYTEGSKNFFQWGINAFFKMGVSFATIKSILLWNESYKQLSKNLSKGTITAYTSRESFPVLLNELNTLRMEKRINDSINSFNTAQKKLLKENELKDDVKQALWRLSRLSETKRINFIKKMSSVNDFNELTRQLKFVTSVHFNWSKESLMDFLTNVEGIKFEKVFESEKVVLVKVLDYETIKQLGKTTNWCISKNKQYWNNYIESNHGQNTQYVIFDFSKLEDDKLSIVGFTTTHNKGITSAHNFINENLMGGVQDENILLDSFISNFKSNNNIYEILSQCGIDITLVAEYDAPLYEWNKNSLFDYLYECVDKENVEILKSADNKMVLSIRDANIHYFFGNAYLENVSSDYKYSQHILFIDFNKSKYDINKLQFAIIEEGMGDEDYCIYVLNERSQNNGKNFDSLLIEYGLPYNTIRRTNNIVVRLRNALLSQNMPMAKSCLKECDEPSKLLLGTIKTEINADSYYDLLISSINNHMSFDYLDIIYNNGLKLSLFMPESYLADLLQNLCVYIKEIRRSTDSFKNMEGITDDEIKMFYSRAIPRREDAKYIGYYVAIKKILENEGITNVNCLPICGKALKTLTNFGRQAQVFEQIINLVIDKIDLSSNNDTVFALAKYVVFFGTDEIKEFFAKKAEEISTLREGIKSLEDSKSKLNSAKKGKQSSFSIMLEQLEPSIYTIR